MNKCEQIFIGPEMIEVFNEDQRDYMRWLGTLNPKDKCWCGWYQFGKCPNGRRPWCPPDKTNQDKLDVQMGLRLL